MVDPVTIPILQRKEPRHTQRQVSRGQNQDLSSHHVVPGPSSTSLPVTSTVCRYTERKSVCLRECHSRMERDAAECVS